ncbi:hypothetical protein PIB30_091274 [Stylosanthes scabra]|uniref:Uncharacterized protein n=1 Tax=Stylosanthes scabra TaxID=79078 RepID=A0ABU6QUE2_9FABA|nr:hypothetical protein [Stylosanthes scabra]
MATSFIMLYLVLVVATGLIARMVAAVSLIDYGQTVLLPPFSIFVKLRGNRGVAAAVGELTVLGAYGCVAESVIKVCAVVESLNISWGIDSVDLRVILKRILEPLNRFSLWPNRIDSCKVRIDSCFDQNEFRVFRVDRIDSGTPRIDSYASRDEDSLPGL